MAFLRPASDKEQVLCKTRFLTIRVFNHLQAAFPAPACGLCKVRCSKAVSRAASHIIRDFPQSQNGGTLPFAPKKSRSSQAGSIPSLRTRTQLPELLRGRNPGVWPHSHHPSAVRCADRGKARLQRLRVEACRKSSRISPRAKTARKEGRVRFVRRPGGEAA